MRSSSKVMARKLGLKTSGEIDAVRLVGPIAPATKRGRPSSSCGDAGGLVREPRAFGVQLVGDLRHAVIGLRDAGRGERVGRDDVGAGAEIGEVDGAHGVRPGEIEKIVVAANLAVPRVEARAAIALLVEAERLDHRAHGAVEHQDALGREAAQRRFVWRVSIGLSTLCSERSFVLRPALAGAVVRVLGRKPSRWQIA